MEYVGLLTRYKVNRPLTKPEKLYQLRQEHRLDVDPLHVLSVIKMNSTYLDTVDKFYGWKGLLTTFAICFGLIMLAILVSVTWLVMGRFSTFSHSDSVNDLLALLGCFAIFFPLIFWMIYFFRKENFRYTHYPIRFNRKTGKVYIFRLDGTVLTVPWRDIFFTLAPSQLRGSWEILGHLLAEDGETVQETFALSYADHLSTAELAARPEDTKNTDHVRRHWEFIRRYMEEGPKTLRDKVNFIMPVDGQRESIVHGFGRLNANFGFLWPVFLPITLVCALGRALAMRTCKIPRWPDDVEAESRVAANDRYVLDKGHPPGKGEVLEG